MIAKGFSRIHWQNLVNFGILPLTFFNPADWDKVGPDNELRLPTVRDALQKGDELFLENLTREERYRIGHSLSPRQVEMILSGSLINVARDGKRCHGATVASATGSRRGRILFYGRLKRPVWVLCTYKSAGKKPARKGVV